MSDSDVNADNSNEGKFYITLFVIVILAFLLIDAKTAPKDSLSFIPKTPNSDNKDCELKTGSHTLEGNVTNLKEKTSSSGNTYYTYKIDVNGCEYSAFSWTEPPDSGTYSGNWGYNQFNQLQFTISNSGSGADNLRDSKCQSYTDYGTDSELDFIEEFEEV